MKQPLELNDDFQFGLDTLEKTAKNLFITGRAGTGKSTLLHLFKNTTRKKCVVLAPGMVFSGRKVIVQHGYQFKSGKSLILEDGVHINALAENGIEVGDYVTIGK